MKKLNLIAGAAFCFFGGRIVTSETPELTGWVLLAIGIILVLTSFSSVSRQADSSGAGISAWGDSNGDGGGE